MVSPRRTRTSTGGPARSKAAPSAKAEIGVASKNRVKERRIALQADQTRGSTKPQLPDLKSGWVPLFYRHWGENGALGKAGFRSQVSGLRCQVSGVRYGPLHRFQVVVPAVCAASR